MHKIVLQSKNKCKSCCVTDIFKMQLHRGIPYNLVKSVFWVPVCVFFLIFFLKYGDCQPFQVVLFSYLQCSNEQECPPTYQCYCHIFMKQKTAMFLAVKSYSSSLTHRLPLPTDRLHRDIDDFLMQLDQALFCLHSITWYSIGFILKNCLLKTNG